MYKVLETDDIKGLQQMFLENDMDVSADDPIHDDVIKCWEIKDDSTGKRIAGTKLEKRNGEYVIVGIAVDKSYRRRKLGSLLLEVVADEVKGLGGSRIMLVAKVPDFFKSMGFVEVNDEAHTKIKRCDGCKYLDVSCFPKVMCLDIL